MSWRDSRKLKMWWLPGLWLGGLLALAWSAPSQAASASGKKPTSAAIGPVYSNAMKAFQAKKWPEALAAFRQLLPMMKALQAKRTKGSKPYHLMTLGRCDVLYHLARIHWEQSDPRASCRLHQRLATLRKQLPTGWQRWQVHPEVPHRLNASATQLANGCKTVPSLITFAIVPASAKVSMKSDDQWLPLPAKGFPTRKRVLTLRFEAAGYETKILPQVKIGQWQLRKLAVVLKKKKPKARPRLVARKAPRRLPPKPPAATPFYKTWWFWTITGVVVVGGTALAVGLALRDQGPERELTFEQNEEGGPGFPIW